jgi:hypothetical protein
MAAASRTRAEVRRKWAGALAIAAAAALLPFLRGLATGKVLYFRDMATLFYPYREYAIEGLRAGQLRYWDPFVHEGVPLLYPPVAYPLDLLQALWPGLYAISLSVVLHVALAAVGFVLLARRLGVSPPAAAAGALVYALGGFLTSTVGHYIHVEAAAWAPFVVLGLRGAAGGRQPARWMAGAAIATALAVSSLGVELALQAIVIGLVLAFRPRRKKTILRAMAAVLLGFGLAAPVVLVMRATMSAGERAHGFPVDIVLNQSLHPFTLLQILVANLYGDLARLPDRWWGSNFFDRGFPYFLSLYLGATTLALVLTGAGVDRRRSRRLVILALVALVVALGRWGGLEPLLYAVPDSLRAFRYPIKAYFTVHFCAAALAAVGTHALGRGRGWRWILALLGALGIALALVPLLPFLLPAGAAWFVAHFFPPAMASGLRATNFAEILADAACGGALAIAAAMVALLVLVRRVSPRLGAALVAAVAAGDLMRAGAGLNPMTDPAGLDTSPEMRAALRALPDLQRVFSCHPEGSRAYWAARRAHPGDHEALTLAAWEDTLTPHFNRRVHVASALGEDLTSLVPLDRLLPPGTGCGNVERLVPWLRAAGVSHVLSLDPIAGPGLRPVAEIAVPRLAPLRVFVAAVSEPVPLRFVAASVRTGTAPNGVASSPDRVWIEDAPGEVDGAHGSVRSLREEPDHLELAVSADRPTALIVLDGTFSGWQATVDDRPAPILSAGHHRAVWLPAGTSRVRMDYRPRGLRPGLAAAAFAAVAVGILSARRGRALGGPARR